VTKDADDRFEGKGGGDGPGGSPRVRHAAYQVLEFVLTLGAAFLIAWVVRTWVVQPFIVPTGSMLPTIQLRDQVLANKFIYDFEAPKPGDIVVFDDPTGEVPILIKRVIAVGGQTVDLRDGKVVVNGKALDEPYTHGLPSEPLMGSQVRFPVTIPVGFFWAMGDNRPNSKDSRWFGPVPLRIVQGRAFVTYWPPDRWGALQ
jgi:signal peptidase I